MWCSLTAEHWTKCLAKSYTTSCEFVTSRMRLLSLVALVTHCIARQVPWLNDLTNSYLILQYTCPMTGYALFYMEWSKVRAHGSRTRCSSLAGVDRSPCSLCSPWFMAAMDLHHRRMKTTAIPRMADPTLHCPAFNSLSGRIPSLLYVFQYLPCDSYHEPAV